MCHYEHKHLFEYENLLQGTLKENTILCQSERSMSQNLQSFHNVLNSVLVIEKSRKMEDTIYAVRGFLLLVNGQDKVTWLTEHRADTLKNAKFKTHLKFTFVVH